MTKYVDAAKVVADLTAKDVEARAIKLCEAIGADPYEEYTVSIEDDGPVIESTWQAFVEDAIEQLLAERGVTASAEIELDTIMIRFRKPRVLN